MTCTETAIKAHSVQNASALALIAEQNHVCQVGMKVKAGELKFEFERIGRNKASTFAGFCAHHDSEIFKPIDTRPISIEDNEQLFLLAYRSVTRELHTVMEAAFRLQLEYQRRLALRLDEGGPLLQPVRLLFLTC